MARTEGRNGVQAWRFAVTSTVQDGETVLKLEGRIGHNGATLLRKTGEQILERGVKRLALDLSGVDYMSSAGLRAIDDLATSLEEQAGSKHAEHNVSQALARKKGVRMRATLIQRSRAPGSELPR